MNKVLLCISKLIYSVHCIALQGLVSYDAATPLSHLQHYCIVSKVRHDYIKIQTYYLGK